MTATESLIVELEDAISSGTVERRIETLWRVTDLFIAGADQYSDDQIDLFDDVIARLAAEIEVTARAKLARRLAPLANAPIKVIKALAFDDLIDVAGPVLTESEQLDDSTLVDTAKTKSQLHLLAISQRRSISEEVTDVLVARGDRQVVRRITRNPGARFSDSGFEVLVNRAEGDDQLAERVGLRPDLPRHHFLKLISKASEAVRSKLATANPEAAEEIRYVVTEVVGKIRSDAVTTSRDYITARKAVKSLHQSGRLGETTVYDLAKARKFEQTAVALSLLCGLPVDVVETAMLDDRTDMLLILAKAAGVSWTTAKSILMLRGSDRALSAHDLETALTSFEKLQPETAQQAVNYYKARKNRAERTP